MTGRGQAEQPSTNWDAYSHEELYRMVWQDADVADVAAIADEWRRHSETLAEHAGRLREEQTALREDWAGEAAELAATQLGALADRVDEISTRAAANQRAAQEAGDALALVRAMLPPPPGVTPPATADAAAAAPATTDYTSDFTSMLTQGTSDGDFTNSFASMLTVPEPPAPPAPPAIPAAPTTTSSANATGGFYFWIGTPPSSTTAYPFSSVNTGSTSMFTNDFAANQSKAQAVYAMQVYESSLNRGGSMISGPGATDARTFGIDRPPAASGAAPVGWQTGAGPAPGGVPWQQLVKTGPVPAAPGPGNAVAGRVPAGVPGMTGNLATEAAAARATGQGGLVPPIGSRGQSDEDEQHVNRMPVIDRGLFAVEAQISVPVIGIAPTGAGQ